MPEKLFSFIRAHQADVLEFLFLAAGLMGVLSQALHHADPGAEMMSLADNVAKHGTLANPFSLLATGPTAVVPPLYPIILAGLGRVYFLVVLGAILANAATALLLPLVSGVFYGDIIPGVIASLLWILTMQSLPGWDTNYTVAGLLLFLFITATPGKMPVTAGIIAGLLFLLNPSTLLIVLPWLTFRYTRHCLIIVAILGIFIMGWTARNRYQLGAFVVRTNLGMTLYASNNDCAESSMFRDELYGCYQAHHPNGNIAEAELVRRQGEVAYDRQRISDSGKWAQMHPARFAKLTMARALQFWFPATESVPASKIYPDFMRQWVRQQNWIAYAIWLVTGLSIPGIILMARRREALTGFVASVLAIYPLLYYVVVSDMRYRYPILFLSLLPAGYFIRCFRG